MKGMDTHLQELVAKAEGKWRNVIGKLEPLQEIEGEAARVPCDSARGRGGTQRERNR